MPVLRWRIKKKKALRIFWKKTALQPSTAFKNFYFTGYWHFPTYAEDFYLNGILFQKGWAKWNCLFKSGFPDCNLLMWAGNPRVGTQAAFPIAVFSESTSSAEQGFRITNLLNIHWKDWCWSWNSNTLATWCEELTHL